MSLLLHCNALGMLPSLFDPSMALQPSEEEEKHSCVLPSYFLSLQDLNSSYHGNRTLEFLEPLILTDKKHFGADFIIVHDR